MISLVASRENWCYDSIQYSSHTSTKLKFPGLVQVTTATNLSFNFDYVFGPSATPSSRLFDECVLPLVDGLFKGYNATVLAYGQTGSGKTFTMGSAFTHGGPQHGVIPRVMETLFARIHKDKENTDFAIRVGFVEIHMVAAPYFPPFLSFISSRHLLAAFYSTSSLS